jgi:hypothetical protein
VAQVNFDLGIIRDIIDTYKEDLVCTLYNSVQSDDGKQALLDKLSELGCTSAEITFLTILILTEHINLLFAESEEDLPADVQSALDGYEGSVGCGVCSDECWFEWVDWEGPLGSGVLSEGGPRTLTSAQAPNNLYYINFRWSMAEGCSCTVKSITLHSLDGFTRANGGSIDDCHDSEWTYGEGDPPLQTYCARNVSMASTTPFSVSVSIGGDCEET